jgi:type IV/VI secretion system ImpK/VasF family protein
MLDETILTTTWGQQSKWHQHKLLHFFHNEDWGGERFFIILKRLCADPALHIDLLELAYICLSLGFTGQYQFVENNHTQLEKTIEHAYQCIRWQRGDIKKELLVTEETKIATHKANLNTKHTEQSLSVWLLGSFTTTLIGTLYLGCNFLLGQAAAPLYNLLLRG